MRVETEKSTSGTTLPTRAFSWGFEYGEVSFSVDGWWLLGWTFGAGKSSYSVVLDAIWDDWRAAVDSAGADAADIHQSIGCYNLPEDPEEWLFWTDGWGAPHKFHMNAMQMLVVYNSSLRDRESQHNCGAGRAFGDFIEDILTTQTGVRSEYLTDDESLAGKKVKNFRIHFLSGEQSRSAVELKDESGEQECSGGHVPDDANKACGSVYDEWEPATANGRVGTFIYGKSLVDAVAGATYYSPADASNFDARNGAPKSDCGFGAAVPTSRDRVWAQAHMLHFYGYISDYVLWLASIAHDYWIETGDVAYYRAARALGRHVLGQILYHAGHMAHEMGHVFCGGNHCSNNNCFMNHARYRFVCAVRGKLGLYHDSLDFSADAGAGYDNDACFAKDNVACSTNTEEFLDFDSSFCAQAGADTSWDAGGFWTATCGSAQVLACQLQSNPIAGVLHSTGFTLGEPASSQFCMSQCTGTAQTGWEAQCGAVEVVSRLTRTLPDGEEMTWRVCG
jgi:hypothetical protein